VFFYNPGRKFSFQNFTSAQVKKSVCAFGLLGDFVQGRSFLHESNFRCVIRKLVNSYLSVKSNYALGH